LIGQIERCFEEYTRIELRMAQKETLDRQPEQALLLKPFLLQRETL
jgi:hypothetical protein